LLAVPVGTVTGGLTVITRLTAVTRLGGAVLTVVARLGLVARLALVTGLASIVGLSVFGRGVAGGYRSRRSRLAVASGRTVVDTPGSWCRISRVRRAVPGTRLSAISRAVSGLNRNKSLLVAHTLLVALALLISGSLLIPRTLRTLLIATALHALRRLHRSVTLRVWPARVVRTRLSVSLPVGRID
jgi:hypothetical protein